MNTQVITLAQGRRLRRRSALRRNGGTQPPGVRPQVRTGTPNALIGMLVFLGAEAMFFAGLISAFLVLRAGSAAWPPPDQPRLPVVVTFVNTLILLFSGYSMTRVVDAMRADRRQQANRLLGITVLLGLAFLLVQGSEWLRLLHYGMLMTSGVYAAMFYVIIGCHGLHVLAGLVLLVAVLWHALQGRFTAQAHVPIEASRLYWLFVVGVWPLLYVLVYLS